MDVYLLIHVAATRANNHLVFRGSRRGLYTINMMTAGRFTEAEAKELCRLSPEGRVVHLMVPLADLAGETMVVRLRDQTPAWMEFRRAELALKKDEHEDSATDTVS